MLQIAGVVLPGSGARLPRANVLVDAIADCDLLYVDNGYILQDWVALRAARRLRIPSISGHHSVILHEGTGAGAFTHNLAWELFGRRLLRRFDRVHALNRTDAAYLERAGAKDVRVARLPIDITTFHPAAKADVFTVLFVGRLHPQKGIDRLQHFIPLLLDRLGGRVRVRIVGAGPEAQRLEPFRSDSRVQILPPIDRAAVAAEMRAAHVLVAPSRTETFGFVVAEALASGTPVVCTRTNGFVDLVSSENGQLINDPDQAEAWLDAITRIHRLPPERYSELSHRARESAAHLGFEAVAAEFDELLNGLR